MPSVLSVPGELLGAADVRIIADRIGIRPTKQLGQNFVIDPNTVQRIVREAAVRSDDVVLEVGPGLGSLTLALLPAAAQVIAVEVDPILAGELPNTVRSHVPGLAHRLTVVEQDALTLTTLHPEPTALIANLPYNVSVPVLIHLFCELPSLRSALVMVQREVGERLAATPGTKTYGVPSVKMQWFGDVTLAGKISRTVFWPEPNVDSVLVRIDRTAPPTGSRERTYQVVDAAFAQRRKMLRRSLAPRYGSGVDAALQQLGIPDSARAEELTVQQFAALAELLPDLLTLQP